MAEVTGLTSAAMQAIADASIISGTVNGSGHLILTKSGGGTVDAGDVIGPTGATGATGADGPDGINATGTIVMFAAATAPTGWLLCDGTAVSRSTFSDLFTLIGVTYGSGNGTTTFNVPNMQGKYPRQDTTALAATGGSDTHSHQIDGGSQAAAAQIVITTGTIINLFENEVTTPSWTASMQLQASSPATSSAGETKGAKVIGQTQTASNDPPYLNLNFIIKT